ncbi:type II toxin-antitoxin system RelE/ParE family toxin [Pseudomonas vancouverensis]|uniref:Type II toxin-antitoxin system RelE/ParE family toxin n=1 Tax=Pseudomonas vancouverensis TaxID=95300 RepID=A0A1H2PDR7_PSEVA|nr:type II toxin-antitoxin system RelE/ParE family toxin [Pseudomonas vancouverensis]KAB0493628.1 type II toxin-antitoxin system RelE/ParE family toxin [Pseudomonas vancouverensis]TDB67795.1 type II toxin-antitoxin system RelE/ParE family toxin [Pseudomonas vancouverensis]SDV15491.1 addiction module toxin, RelE/StbE family [Pseudomonas vancouverensis]
MKIIWTKEAAQDRADIWDYLNAVNPKAAIDMDSRFSDAAALLAQYPESGPAGIISGTREIIPHSSYRMVYQLESEAIWILALVHTSRQWPSG